MSTKVRFFLPLAWAEMDASAVGPGTEYPLGTTLKNVTKMYAYWKAIALAANITYRGTATCAATVYAGTKAKCGGQTYLFDDARYTVVSEICWGFAPSHTGETTETHFLTETVTWTGCPAAEEGEQNAEGTATITRTWDRASCTLEEVCAGSISELPSGEGVPVVFECGEDGRFESGWNPGWWFRPTQTLSNPYTTAQLIDDVLGALSSSSSSSPVAAWHLAADETTFSTTKSTYTFTSECAGTVRWKVNYRDADGELVSSEDQSAAIGSPGGSTATQTLELTSEGTADISDVYVDCACAVEVSIPTHATPDVAQPSMPQGYAVPLATLKSREGYSFALFVDAGGDFPAIAKVGDVFYPHLMVTACGAGSSEASDHEVTCSVKLDGSALGTITLYGADGATGAASLDWRNAWYPYT